MSYPKLRPCPRCGSSDFLEVYTYDSGWRYVECNNGFNMVGVPFCGYRGPGEGSILAAIRSHNASVSAPEIQPTDDATQTSTKQEGAL